MPAKKRPAARRPPALLRTPMTRPKGYDYYEVGGVHFKGQIDQRIDAAYEHYKINPSLRDAQRELIVALLMEQFPTAFRVVKEGRRSVAGNKTKWTFEQRFELVDFVSKQEAAGISQREACRQYAEKVGQSTDSIVQRNQEARKALKDKGIIWRIDGTVEMRRIRLRSRPLQK
jgi:hypothetical protein